MKAYTAAAVAALAAMAEARRCQNLTVPITASARNGVFNVSTPVTNIDVTNFILDLTQQGKNYSANTLTGYATVSGKYNIAATYCEPDSGPADTLQILTHGIGFDRSYWDLPANNYNYSYVKEAVDEYGYSTFTYDRLGIGMSSHGEPVNEIQAWLEVDALKELTLMLRAGSVSGISKAYAKTVHAGHSFGSEHTYALTAMYPNITDAIALTGFSQNGSFIPYFGLGGNFLQANLNPALTSYVDGYLAASDQSAVQTNFFAPGAFDPAILAIATSTGQPVTVGELLTIGGETGSVNHFPDPVLIITGGRDIPYCGGNCYSAPTGYPNIPSTSKNNFPDAKSFQVVIVGEAGHGLNLEYSHPYTYSEVLNFFLQNVPPGGKATPEPTTVSAPAQPDKTATGTEIPAPSTAAASYATTPSAAAASEPGHWGQGSWMSKSHGW
ncbi:putative alpha beta-hydrolase protein [Teratosphaeria destructans]|uniref:Alpha beta-hydrolase protein n=1 Tax=Teratosphaeria destructans TaxID=418781 RepID=A0A9W7SV48_9PEZI|nr:putative alpha beta-hydrolase protein [Teratosphaeria destructans]